MTDVFAHRKLETPRRNLWLAIAAVALGQAAVLGWMIWDRASLLSHGREVVLDVIPVDPRSLFRGDYVILGYDISRVKLPAGSVVPKRGDAFFVTLHKGDDGSWTSVATSAHPPESVAAGDVVLRGRVTYAYQPSRNEADQQPNIGLSYGIESYFVPEGTGRELERMVGDRKISAILAVDDSGTAAIKGLMADGKRVYEEPLL
ncbi:GDYXXLXY domain-containing protein [Hyphomicrobium sp. D-2]|uniref:GDYXXLXY domain-containing protein n=1 Tax=Hyphomicrobium sp. D-2 TaxID=3041621 RepID=UPI0024562CD8|nr:GDYXXLXY domain-containing protein [Hyphomicrobium sp. D-2]MDH4982851.1 GDYXXLXY domain-containing protein [Hyphomicrobium sp. D-2]